MNGLLRSVLATVPGLRRKLRGPRIWLQTTLLRLRSYWADYRNDQSYLNWKRSPGDYWRLSSELIFWYHKLEKGLCLPIEKRRFFGEYAASETVRLLGEWRDSSNDTSAPIYQAAIEALRAWYGRLKETPPPDSALQIVKDVEGLLRDAPSSTELTTPIPARPITPQAFEQLSDLLRSRRSMRDFDGQPVDLSLVEAAVTAAQLSPSACNRQPWRLHLYDDPTEIRDMLALQNGNSGFGHRVPLLAVVAADLGTFFDASERIEPILDGGLFLMSLLLALQAQGLSTCCLNWCVEPGVDRQGHVVGGIPNSEKILTFLAIGTARDGAIVPLSARRPLSDVIRRHSVVATSANQQREVRLPTPI